MLAKNVDLNGKTILVTGAAGFIGSVLVSKLFETVNDATIIGLDSVNDYYEVSLKEYRLNELSRKADEAKNIKWEFVKGNLADKGLYLNFLLKRSLT